MRLFRRKRGNVRGNKMEDKNHNKTQSNNNNKTPNAQAPNQTRQEPIAPDQKVVMTAEKRQIQQAMREAYRHEQLRHDFFPNQYRMGGA